MALPAPLSPAISLHDAVALSGRFPLLAGVDLEVARGETVLVEGPNGAGKTSLLRVCAGLVTLASGRVEVLGFDPGRQRNRVRRRVGMLSHASHLYDDLTVRENVRFAVRAAGGDTGRIDGACSRLGLTGRLLKTSASKLSAGQRRRVALAVLAARWPELWLLDEPHAGLDASARAILNELVAEATDAGVTVVIASHEAEYVESLATRAVMVTGGRVTAERPIAATPPLAAPSVVDPVPTLPGTGQTSEGQVAHVA
jgi:heme ABC exporter ATP-binding subunit CcmA